jgi:hypothetical protein
LGLQRQSHSYSPEFWLATPRRQLDWSHNCSPQNELLLGREGWLLVTGQVTAVATASVRLALAGILGESTSLRTSATNRERPPSIGGPHAKETHAASQHGDVYPVMGWGLVIGWFSRAGHGPDALRAPDHEALRRRRINPAKTGTARCPLWINSRHQSRDGIRPLRARNGLCWPREEGPFHRRRGTRTQNNLTYWPNVASADE